jgi:hypothetical protein
LKFNSAAAPVNSEFDSVDAFDDGERAGKKVSAQTTLRKSSKNRKDLLQNTTFMRPLASVSGDRRSTMKVGLLSCSSSSMIPTSCKGFGVVSAISSASSLSTSALANRARHGSGEHIALSPPAPDLERFGIFGSSPFPLLALLA